MPGQRPTEDQRLRDMSAAIAKTLRFTEGMSPEAFFEDERTQYAVVALLEIIGEAAWWDRASGKPIPKSLGEH